MYYSIRYVIDQKKALHVSRANSGSKRSYQKLPDGLLTQISYKSFEQGPAI